MSEPVVSSHPTVEQREFWRLWKSYKRAITAIGVLLILVVSLVFAVVSQRVALEAERQSRAQCQLNKYVAEAPLGAKQPSLLALRFVAGSRVAYVEAHCKLGKLAPPDRRLFPYLPPQLRK